MTICFGQHHHIITQNVIKVLSPWRKILYVTRLIFVQVTSAIYHDSYINTLRRCVILAWVLLSWPVMATPSLQMKIGKGPLPNNYICKVPLQTEFPVSWEFQGILKNSQL